MALKKPFRLNLEELAFLIRQYFDKGHLCRRIQVYLVALDPEGLLTIDFYAESMRARIFVRRNGVKYGDCQKTRVFSASQAQEHCKVAADWTEAFEMVEEYVQKQKEAERDS